MKNSMTTMCACYILLYTCLRRQRKWSEVQHPLGANGFMRGESVDRAAGAEKKWLCQGSADRRRRRRFRWNTDMR